MSKVIKSKHDDTQQMDDNTDMIGINKYIAEKISDVLIMNIPIMHYTD